MRESESEKTAASKLPSMQWMQWWLCQPALHIRQNSTLPKWAILPALRWWFGYGVVILFVFLPMPPNPASASQVVCFTTEIAFSVPQQEFFFFLIWNHFMSMPWVVAWVGENMWDFILWNFEICEKLIFFLLNVRFLSFRNISHSKKG